MFKRLLIACLVIGGALGCESDYTYFSDDVVGRYSRDNRFARALKGVQNDTQVMALLATCERPNAVDIGGYTLLELAAERGQKEAVEKLFEKGADPAKQVPLKYAKDLAMAQLLHKHNAAGIGELLGKCIGAGRFRIHDRTVEEIKEDRLLALWALRNGASASASKNDGFSSSPIICEAIKWGDLFSVIMFLRGHADLRDVGDASVLYSAYCDRAANTKAQAIHEAILAAAHGNFPDINCSIKDYVKIGISEESARGIYETMQEIVALEKELPRE